MVSSTALCAVKPGLTGLLCIFMVSVCNAVCPLSEQEATRRWVGMLADWSAIADGAIYQFGEENVSQNLGVLRVIYPKGSYDPSAVRASGAPLGGAQFRTPFHRKHIDINGEVGIRYLLRFDENFRFTRGGKLPGLYGGTANTGGKVPTGADGFSLRFVWQEAGSGALSVYLPTSAKWGTVFGLGNWRFSPGHTSELAMYVRLNTPGRDDGVIAAWADDELIVYATDIVFRTTRQLQVDGFYFSTFFGGGTPDWATPVDTSIEFGKMELFSINLTELDRCASHYGTLQLRREVK